MLRVRSNESKTDVHSKKLPSARPIIRKHGFDETALLGVALMGVSSSSTNYEDGRVIIGIGAHTNEMDAACNHCCYGVLWGEKPQFLHKRKVAVKGGVNRTCEWLHFGDKSSPDPCSGVEITLVGCLTSCITPKTTDVTRTAVTSVSGCNHRETDVKPPGLATLSG